MPTYAANTSTTSDKSRAEIERTLARYGAEDFGYISRREQAVIMFTMQERTMRFHIPLPDRQSTEFTQTPGRGYERTAAAAEAAYEQAVRQKWRALALVVKAKLEAVESGIVTFEDEFAMHMLLPDGSTVAEHVVGFVNQSYALGTVQPFKAITGPTRKA